MSVTSKNEFPMFRLGDGSRVDHRFAFCSPYQNVQESSLY